jgi:hypothetical protein
MRTAFLGLALCAAMTAQDGALADRVGATGFVQLTAESFNKLTPREQALAYWLSQASIDTDPIILRAVIALRPAAEATARDDRQSS